MKKEFRILLTEKCNANCPNCFNSNYRLTSEMSLYNLKKLSIFLSKNGISALKIMGGEPTIHSSFLDAMKIIQNYFCKTYLFTNGIAQTLLDYCPRDNDVIVYNLNLINIGDNPNKFLLNKPGFRAFETQIGTTSNEDIIIEKLLYLQNVFQNKKKLIINLTLDCTENIFKNKNAIIAKWGKVSFFITNTLKTNFNVDHIIPKCFMNSNPIFNFKPRTCKYSCGGLIDTNYKLRFCNQYPAIIKDIFEFNNLQEIENALNLEHQNKLTLSYNNKCKNCPNFNISCNGGCFTHKEIFQ